MRTLNARGWKSCAFGSFVGLGLLQTASAQVFMFNMDGSDPSKSNTSKLKDKSHSHFAGAFNSGPRQQAKLVTGIGNAHFPITTKNPLVQKFFDQGLNQLYSFMYFEAERSFRQAVMLEPDNPMPFWGIAMTVSNKAEDCLRLAKERQQNVSERERRYFAALELLYDKESKADKSKAYRSALEKIVMDYPEDIEAKLLLAEELWHSVDREGGQRSAVDALLKDVLAKNPLHPAANHFRIHLWDGPDAKMALDSCAAYPKAAPGIGHAQHMPGHIYAQLGMWEQAAYQMDAATRLERKYMSETRQLPFDTWNYSHNQHYLICNLGYAGRLEEGERLAAELIRVPRDPVSNNDSDFSIVGEGRMAMLRMWLRGEQWDKILADEKAGWPSLPRGKSWRLFAKTVALTGKGRLDDAAASFKEFEELKPGGDAPKCALAEAKGRLLMAQGRIDEGLAELKTAFEIEKSKFLYNDPGPYPRPAGDTYVQSLLKAGKIAEAEKCARESLAHDPHSGVMLSYLAEALLAQGKKEEALSAAKEFESVFKYANSDLAPVRKMKDLGLTGAWSPSRYKPPHALENMGPIEWSPFEETDFNLLSAEGKKVRLSDFRGKNVILVCILSGSCEHCVEQLKTFGEEKAEWDKLNTQVLVVCPDKCERLSASFGDKVKYPFPFLSDPDHRVAKLYKAYDEFEGLEQHATVYITPEGKVWWFRTGSAPFTDMKFLKEEIERVAQMAQPVKR